MTYTKPAEDFIDDGINTYCISRIQQEIIDLETKKIQKQTNIQNQIAYLLDNLDGFTNNIDAQKASKQILIDAYNEL